MNERNHVFFSSIQESIINSQSLTNPMNSSIRFSAKASI